ncbi:hypothetical protein LK459_14520 [Gordonia otitidis]|uniref:hypothetical protein n=1 Tax=Gordonia otitidis TaxID=249058 RepID=UPI001D14E18B|nr:hypothetical protein [Gordonia otitidis]UEA57819.1 hypothetical protein LK459_14520 [Gordonia otitidis]
MADDVAPEPFVLLTHGVSGTESTVILDSSRVVEVPGMSGCGFKGEFTTYPPRPTHVQRPRNRVAYRWGNMTSGLAVQAIWALFGPFALVNVAAWMYPKVPQGNPTARACVAVLRLLLRLLGLALTVTMVAQLTLLIDGVLFRPVSDGAPRDWAVLGCLTVIFGVGAFVALCADNDKDVRGRPDPSPQSDPADPPLIATDSFVSPSDGRATTLITTHAVSGILTAAIVLSDTATPRWLWGVVVVMLTAVVTATMLCDDSRSATAQRWRPAFVSWPAVAWVVLASALLVWANFCSKPHHIVGGSIRWLFLLDSALVGLAVVATLGALVLPRNVTHWWARRNQPTTPWLNGLHAPLVAAVGVLWGVGMGVALTRIAAIAVDHRDPVKLPDVYADTAWMWGVTVLVWGLGVVVCVGGSVVANGWSRASLAIRQQQAVGLRRPTGRQLFIKRIQWGFATVKLRIPACVGTLVLCAAAASITAAVGHRVVDGSRGFEWVGVIALGLVDLMLLRAMYNAARKPRKAGRSLGVLWDLASFWPREAHPLVPPAYAPRAIRDLERFMRTKSHRPVILAAHSQGSLIMYALAYRLVRRRDGISLLTYGSQLGWAYGRAFPAALSHASHKQLRKELNDTWINLVRLTDFIGDGVVSYTDEGALRRYEETCRVGHELCDGGYVVRENDRIVEVWLPDPSPGDNPPDVTHQHSAYTSDITWDTWIALLSN